MSCRPDAVKQMMSLLLLPLIHGSLLLIFELLDPMMVHLPPKLVQISFWSLPSLRNYATQHALQVVLAQDLASQLAIFTYLDACPEFVQSL